jgi:hypothetical protein
MSVAVLLLAGCARPWQVSRQPKLGIDVAAGCPGSITGYADVVSTYAGSELVPASPNGGVICQYAPLSGSRSRQHGQLAEQLRLSRRRADQVADAVRGLSLRAPGGTYHCPADLGSVVIIGLSYATGPDVGLWYADSGCKTLDNGRLGVFEGGNPSFYNGFERAVSIPPPLLR